MMHRRLLTVWPPKLRVPSANRRVPARVLVGTIHRAIRNNLGRIRKETDGDRPLSQATKNCWKRFRERLRLALSGAKTSDQCRNAICTLFANAGVLKELKDG